MGGKWIQLLKEITPRMVRIAVIYNPETSPFERFLPSMRVSADALGVEVTVARVHDGAAIEQAVGSLAQAGDAGLVFPLILIRIRMGGSLRSQHSTASRQFTAFH
jgi:putative ABC transport system substrate-binding protein